MSEFDDWAYENGLSRTKDEDGYFSKNTEFSSKAWQHQQAKVCSLEEQVEELQRRNQMLNDNIKEQGQKLVYQNEVIETQAEKLLGLRDEKAELQKRVDQQGLIIAKAMSIASDLQKSWSMFEIGKKLEQALKGEGK